MKEKGAGKNSNGTHAQVSVRLPKDLLESIQRRAKAERRNRSNMIGWLLREAMRSENRR